MALAQRQSAQHDHDIEYSITDEFDIHTESAHDATSSSTQTDANLTTHNQTHSDHADFASRRRARSRHHAERHAHNQADDEALPRSFREWEELARDASRDEKQSARLASRRAHRAFRMTWITSVAGAILFAQLLGVLYFKALAVSASHRADDLEKLIAVEEATIDKTQRKISLVSNDPRMATWAEKSGYHAATQNDLDDVMNPQPLAQTPDIEYSKREETR